ncbi:MAG TPA: hypothetical protein VHQ20_00050 [Patescibacteria group bacterium]|jgi:hypothetical protein|nr:hypothetical protein [Patescibacteria group bacterium]
MIQQQGSGRPKFQRDYRGGFREMTQSEIDSVLDGDNFVASKPMADADSSDDAPSEKRTWFVPHDHYVDQVIDEVALELATEFGAPFDKLTREQIAAAFSKMKFDVQEVNLRTDKDHFHVKFGYSDDPVAVRVDDVRNKIGETFIHLTS